MSKINYILIGFLIGLSACASNPVDSNDTVYSEVSVVHIKRADALLNAFIENGSADDLIAAEKIYKSALEQSPDDMSLQRGHYSAVYMLSAMNFDEWFSVLEYNFSNVDPRLKKDLTPPDYLKFQLIKNQNLPWNFKIYTLKNALLQQPEFAPAWYWLSEAYAINEQYEQAYFAALQASKYGDSAAIEFQMGENLYRRAWGSGCAYEDPEAINQVVKLFSSAVSKNPEIAYFKLALAGLYAEVGLYPLALNVSNMTSSIDHEELKEKQAIILANVLLASGQLDEAKHVLDTQLAASANPEATFLLSLVALEINEWEKAASFSEHYRDDVYTDKRILFHQWVSDLGRGSAVTPELLTEKIDVYELDIVIDDYQSILASDSSLNERSYSKCEITEALFYLAMQEWYKGQVQNSKRYLQQILALKTYKLSEYKQSHSLISVLGINE
ncbi:MAG: tetratricopeptide repeat protein [Rickettsiales bacterium]